MPDLMEVKSALYGARRLHTPSRKRKVHPKFHSTKEISVRFADLGLQTYSHTRETRPQRPPAVARIPGDAKWAISSIYSSGPQIGHLGPKSLHP